MPGRRGCPTILHMADRLGRAAEVRMKARTLLFAALLALTVGAGVEAARMPKPVSLVDRVETSWSHGTTLGQGKYQGASWGNRWWQSLGRAPIVTTPWVQQY